MFNRESQRVRGREREGERVTKRTYLAEKVLCSENEIKRECNGIKIICPKK